MGMPGLEGGGAFSAVTATTMATKPSDILACWGTAAPAPAAIPNPINPNHHRALPPAPPIPHALAPPRAVYFTTNDPSPLTGNQAALAANLAAAAAAIPLPRLHNHHHQQQKRNPSTSLLEVASMGGVNAKIPTGPSPALPPIALPPAPAFLTAPAPVYAATAPPVRETGGSSPQCNPSPFSSPFAPLKDEETELLAMFFAEDGTGAFGEFGLDDVPNVCCQASSLGAIEDLQPFPRAPAPLPPVLPVEVTQALPKATAPVVTQAPAPRALVAAPQPVPSPLPAAPAVARTPMTTSAVTSPIEAPRQQQKQQQQQRQKRRNHQPTTVPTQEQFPQVQRPSPKFPPRAAPSAAQGTHSNFQRQSLTPKDPSKFPAATVGSFPPSDPKKAIRKVGIMKRSCSMVGSQVSKGASKMPRISSTPMGGVAIAGSGIDLTNVSWRPVKREGAATRVSFPLLLQGVKADFYFAIWRFRNLVTAAVIFPGTPLTDASPFYAPPLQYPAEATSCVHRDNTAPRQGPRWHDVASEVP